MAAAGIQKQLGQQQECREQMDRGFDTQKSRLAGRIQWHNRLCPAYEGRNPGKGTVLKSEAPVSPKKAPGNVSLNLWQFRNSAIFMRQYIIHPVMNYPFPHY